jgi:hypothetical protein
MAVQLSSAKHALEVEKMSARNVLVQKKLIARHVKARECFNETETEQSFIVWLL